MGRHHFDFHSERDYSDRAYYGIALVLRYAIFIVETTSVKFVVLALYYLCTTNGTPRHTIPNIKIDGIDVEQVDHAKLLGVTISHDLSWNKHVENIVKKAGKRLYMLYQLKRAGISQSDLVTVYLSVVRPVLEYACPVWHTNLQQYLSDNIETIQKKSI